MEIENLIQAFLFKKLAHEIISAYSFWIIAERERAQSYYQFIFSKPMEFLLGDPFTVNS